MNNRMPELLADASRLDTDTDRELATIGWARPRLAVADLRPRKVVAVTLSDLLARSLPPRKVLLAPWLTSQSLTMIHAWRGTGKTHVALGIAYALASGGAFLKWAANRPVSVLYLDGEMPGAVLQARLAAIVGAAKDGGHDVCLKLVTPDLQPDAIMPDLATHEGQDAVEAEIGDAEVIIVDNISCLVRATGKENEADSWTPVAEWALRQRAHGKAVVFIHHSGNNGSQRGTSKREDILDTTIALRRPGDYEESQGARFEVHFEKARGLFGRDIEPFEASLGLDADEKQQWTIKNGESGFKARILEMAERGMEQSEIARALDCNRSTVCRHLKGMAKQKSRGRSNPGARRIRQEGTEELHVAPLR